MPWTKDGKFVLPEGDEWPSPKPAKPAPSAPVPAHNVNMMMDALRKYQKPAAPAPEPVIAGPTPQPGPAPVPTPAPAPAAPAAHDKNSSLLSKAKGLFTNMFGGFADAEKDIFTHPKESLERASKRVSAGFEEIAEPTVKPVQSILFGGEKAEEMSQARRERHNEVLPPEISDTLNQVGEVTALMAGGEVLGPAKALQGLKALNTARTAAGALKATLPKAAAGIGEQAASLAANTGIAAAGASVLKGAQTPDLGDRNYGQRVGASLTAGMGDTTKQIGAAAKFLGFKNLGNDMEQFGDKVTKGFEQEQKDFTWMSLLDPEFYARNVARTIPTSLALMPLALIGGAAGGAAAGAAGLGAFGRAVLQSIGASAMSAPMEAAMEAGGVYESERQKGKSDDEARSAASKTFWGNAALLGATNMSEFMTMFLPAGKFGTGAVGRIATGAAQGAAEEVAQSAISQTATGEKLSVDPQEAAIGALLGGGFGVAGAINESHDKLSAITDDVIARLDNETRQEYNEALAEAGEMGLTEEEAQAKVLDAIAQHPEGKKLIAGVVKEHIESAGMEQLAAAPVEISETAPAPDAQKGPLEAPAESAPNPASEPPAPQIAPEAAASGDNLAPILPEPEKAAVQSPAAPLETPPAVEPPAPPKAAASAPDASVKAPADAAVGDTITLKGKGEQKFTITGTEGSKYVSLQSEHGGEIPKVSRQAIDRVLSPEAPSEEAPAAPEEAPAPAQQQSGNRITAKTERGTPVELHYAVVSADSLTVSHDANTGEPNAAYPQELQPRDRSRAASEEQVNRILSKLEPTFLGESPKTSEGAPIISPENVVESGNGRTMALARGYAQGHKNMGAYKEFLRKNIESFGLKPSSLVGVNNPVLVRVRDTPMDMEQRIAFAKESNEQATSALSAVEQAKQDAGKLKRELLVHFNPGSEMNMTAATNREFIRGFMQDVVGENERGRYVDSTGAINQDGVRRITNAVFARVYGHSNALENMAESTDSNVKNITHAMLLAAPRMLDVKERVEAGSAHPVDLTPEITSAVAKMSELRDNGQTVEFYFNQGDLFGDDLSDDAKNVLVVLEATKRSAKKLTEIFDAYADLAIAAGDPKQTSLFGDEAPPTKSEILEAAIRKVEGEDGEQIALWEEKHPAGDGGEVVTAEEAAEPEPEQEPATEAGEEGVTPFQNFAAYAREYGLAESEINAAWQNTKSRVFNAWQKLIVESSNKEQEIFIDGISDRLFVEDWKNPRYFRASNSANGTFQISKSLLQDGGTGIIAKLHDGPPDSMDTTVYLNGHPETKLLLEEVQDMDAYPEGVHPGTLPIDDILFRITTPENFDTGEYISGDAILPFDEALDVAEKMLRHKFRAKAAPAGKEELPAPRDFEKLFFSLSPNDDEIAAVKAAKPKNVLMSYGTWAPEYQKRGKDNKISIKQFLQRAYGNNKENRPTVIIDNGAASNVDIGFWDVFDFFTTEWDSEPGAAWLELQRVEVEEEDGESEIQENYPEFVKFVEWVEKNNDVIDYVLAPDSMDERIEPNVRQEMANYAYLFFRAGNIKFIPVFQRGADVQHLKDLIAEGADYIALGGTKNMKENERADYVNGIIKQFPNTKFHLLGTNNQRLIDKIPGLYSADGSRWMIAGREGRTGTADRAAGMADEITKREQTVESKKTKGETANEPDTLGNDGEETLEGTPAENVPGAAADGEAEPSGGSGAGANQGRGSRSGAKRNGSSSRVGSDEGNVDSAAGRGNDADAGEQSSGLESPAAAVKQPSSSNYVITDDDLGIKGAKTSFRKNVDAIKLMKQIMSEGRPATADEQKVLVQYVGWGGIKQPFEPTFKVPADWKAEAAELKELLTPEEWQKAADTILNAHYTSREMIESMYAGLAHLGFDGGRVLEPSMGIGHFIGLMPRELAKGSRITGVEIDPVTGNIGRLLYPKSDVRIMGFQDTKIADDFYDAAIGNVPFGRYGVSDRKYADYLTGSIHNYFFAKTLDKVRPGGIVMFITSRYTMDATDSKVRRYIAGKADLIGAIRLPNTAFKKNANTEVVTDVLILQKRADGAPASGPAWTSTKPMAIDGLTRVGAGGEFEVNEYFHANPGNVLGTFANVGSQYGGELTVNPLKGGDLQGAVTEALRRLPANVFVQREKKATEEATPRELVPAPGHIKENAYVVHGDKVFVNQEGQLVPVDVPAKSAARLKGMIGVRDAVRDYLRLQLEPGANDNAITASRKRLNQVYDAFVKTHGALNDAVNARLFIDDPDAYLLLSLEKYDKDKKTAAKADIFTKRTVQRYVPVEKAGSAKEALVIALNEKGRVDLNRMSALTGQSEDEIERELNGHIYNDPFEGWVTADQYLSGNVKEKLLAAQNAAALDPAYQPNVDALEAVQPVPLEREEIDVKLGAHWIPQEHIRDFVAQLIGVGKYRVKIGYNNALAEWTVEPLDSSIKFNTDNTVTWGTPNKTALQLIEGALNLQSPKVTIKYRDGDQEVVDREASNKATVAAREKQNQIKEEFVRWLWSDEGRAAALVQLYNDRFNTDRLREFDGDHLTFPGMNPGITMKEHQKAAVWRAIQSGNTLLAHAVGAGKTFEMIAAMMEMKRLGIVSKPMWVVPNHLVSQMGTDFLKLYPAANILVAGKQDFEAKNRKKLFAKIATGTYDAVIVPHSSFGKISMSKKVVEQFYQQQLDELTDAIIAEAEGGKRKDTGLAKNIRAARKRLEKKMDDTLAKIDKDDNVSFEELGVDGLVVDEAHEFKNLFYTTKLTRVAGLGSQEGSGKAFDLFMKTRYLQKLNGGRGVIFATGTPVSNTLAEMYTFQRYLQYDELERRGISNFDSWVSQFGSVKNVMELSPEGKGLRLRTRLTEIVNLPELLHLFRAFADVKTGDELEKAGLIERPKLAGGQRAPVVVPATDELRALVSELAERADAIRSGRVKPDEDNMLAIVGEGRKAALDMRLVDPEAEDHPDSKVNIAAQKIAEIHKATKKQRSTQLVFLDLSTPRAEKLDKDGNPIASADDDSGVSIYNELREKLIKRGIPKAEIAFIHDYNTDAKKEELFRKVNLGEIRILLGSTAKMGAGMNVQTKLKALHHLDVPWRPSDIEQREGRILRQGNENEEVEIYAYMTEESFDAYMWQTIANKAKVVDQTMSGDLKARRAEDPSGMELSANELKALATGDTRIIELANLDREVAEMEYKRASSIDQLRRVRSDLKSWPAELASAEKQLANFKADIASRKETRGDKFSMTIGKNAFTDRKEAGTALIKAADELAPTPEPVQIGTFAGFTVNAMKKKGSFSDNETVRLTLDGAGSYSFTLSESDVGTIRSMESTVSSIDNRAASAETNIAEAKVQVDKLKTQETRLAGEIEASATAYNEKRAKKLELEAALNVDKKADEDGAAFAGDDEAPRRGRAADEDDEELAFASGGGSKKPRNTKKRRIATLAGAIKETQRVLTPKASERISDLIAKTLKTSIDRDFVRRGAEGTYNLRSRTGQVRSRSFAEWRVVGHELGHAFSDKIKQIGDEEELRAMAAALYPGGAKNLSRDKQIEEGFAEFFRFWVADPDLARQNAPKTTQKFEDYYQKDEKLNGLFNSIRATVDNDFADDALGRAVGGVIVDEVTDDGTDYGDYWYQVPWYQRHIFEAADSLIPAKAFEKAAVARGYAGDISLVKIASNMGDPQSKAMAQFNAGQRDAEGRFVEGSSLKSLFQKGVNIIGEAVDWKRLKLNAVDEDQSKLTKRFYTKYKTMTAVQMFSAILIARRVQERYDAGFTKLPMTRAQADEIMQIAEQRFPGAKEAAEDYARQLSDTILERLVREEVITEEDRERIEAGSDFYIPFIYDDSTGPKRGGKSQGGRTYGKGVHRFRGSVHPVLNAFQATMMKLTEIEQVIEYKRLMSTVHDMAKTPDVGNFARIVPDSQKATQVSAEQVMEAAGRLMGLDRDSITTLQEQVAGSGALTFFTAGGLQALNQSEPVIMDRRNGKMTMIKVAPDFFRTIMALRPIQLNGVARAFAWISRASRYTGLATVSYVKNAVARDIPTASLQSKHFAGLAKNTAVSAGIMFGTYMKHRGINTGFTEYMEKQYDLFVSSGGASGAAENMLRGMMQRRFNDNVIETKAAGWVQMIGRGGRKTLVRLMHSPSDMLRFIEEGPRIAEFNATIKAEFKRMGYDEKEMYHKLVMEGTDALPEPLQEEMKRILVEAVYGSGEITTNFRLHGASEVARQYMTTVSFLAGTVQGTARTIRQVREHKVKTLLFAGLVVGGMSALAMALMKGDDDDRKWLNDMDSSMRDKYWWFRNPFLDGSYIAIAKPFDYALVANVVERFLDWHWNHEQANTRKPYGDMKSLFGTVTATQWFNNYARTGIEMYYNQSSFGSPIVPVSEQSTANYLQYGPKTSFAARELSRWMAEWAGDGRSPSPRMFDYFWRENFGKYGALGLSAADYLVTLGETGSAKEAAGSYKAIAGAEYNPMISGALVYSKEEGSSRVVNKFYDDLDKTTKLYNTLYDLASKNQLAAMMRYATPENIQKIRVFTAMKSISSELSDQRSFFDEEIAKTGITAAERRRLVMQKDYMQKLAAGIPYGLLPPAPDDSTGLTEAGIEQQRQRIIADASKKTANELKSKRGPSDMVKLMEQALAVKEKN